MVFHSANAKKATKVIKGNKCPTCGANVSRATDLSRHMLIHSPHRREMMHQCPWKGCGYATLQKANLNTHINTKHTHAKRFPCQVCPKTFNDQSAAIRHRRGIHNMDTRAFRRFCAMKDSDSGYESDSPSRTPKLELDMSELLTFDAPSEPQSAPVDVSIDTFAVQTHVKAGTSATPEVYAPGPTTTVHPTDLAMLDAFWSQDGQTSSDVYCFNAPAPTPMTPRSAVLPMPESYLPSSLDTTSGYVYGNNDFINTQYSDVSYATQAQSSSYGYGNAFDNNAFDYSAPSYAFTQSQQPQQPQFDFNFGVPAPASTAVPEGNYDFDSQDLEYYLTLEYLRQQQQPEQWPIC
ncbi:hypothetical protein CONPUDRAFT_88270 [Coniophora puteana RWD-64-598 SS2]|uniref:C2H2-type domain-containing protein n=1 Tax=Coniophora puteana (strain RWD-64-598) TaxID=741705 RepID=A0A5M3MYK2_CONPW|nr:uncharacterized protein CONPUDRAFT_88270 [Coniophora puteana RWD-64-598 SS2]EIW83864.1 hypothetical protein CONPUDRAFT_88270 [Coniophora puteana RWD-64-598 SS2]